MNISQNAYLKKPCRASSLPYWKTVHMTLSENMLILHGCDFTQDHLKQYTDEVYFRIMHDLKNLHSPSLPDGFCLCNIPPADYAMHINFCYTDISMTENEMRSYSDHPTYSPELWIAVKNEKTGEIAATGIAELDKDTEEGILEWIQVSEAYRRCGLGTYIVSELLCRIAKKARFATVSGQVDNPSNPEALYRKCGFIGNDMWHILRKKEIGESCTGKSPLADQTTEQIGGEIYTGKDHLDLV